MKSYKIQTMARCAMIAALYTAVSLLLAPLSYGAVQVRIAEALTLLPVFGPDAILGVTLGCLLTNLLGSSPIDALFGTLATLLAAVMTWKLRGIRWRSLPVLSALMPVLFNAVIVGAEITFFFMETPATGAILAFNMLTVGLGEVISCMVLGLLPVKGIEKNHALQGFFCG